jgi:hypothetical protein
MQELASSRPALRLDGVLKAKVLIDTMSHRLPPQVLVDLGQTPMVRTLGGSSPSSSGLRGDLARRTPGMDG